MTRKERLRENYEDALFALLMEAVIEEEGKNLIAENEKLKADPNAEVPEDVTRRCIKAIKTAFSKKHQKSAAKVIYRAFSKVAVVAVICALLFTVAYAAIPEVRIKTLNLLIEVSDVSTKLTLQDTGSDFVVNVTPPPEPGEGIVLLGYQFPCVPEDFLLDPARSGSEKRFAWAFYKNEIGATIEYNVYKISAGSPFRVDTESADLVQEINLHGCAGLLVKKGPRTHIVWTDVEQSVFCTVICKDLDSQFAMELASAVIFLDIENNE